MVDFFYNLFKKIQSNKLLGILGFLILLLGLGYFSSKITFEEDITKLIPTNDKNAEAQKVLKTVNFADKIIVHISTKPNGNINDLTQYAEVFIDSLNQNAANYITSIQGKVEDKAIGNTMDFVYNNLPLFINPSDYKNIAQKLNEDSIDVVTKGNYKTLVSPSGIVAKKTILKDPLGLSFIGLKKLQNLSIGDGFSVQNGFVVSKDKKHVLLFISPKHASSETAENAELSNILYRLNNELNTVYGKKVTAEYFGGALIAVENAKQIKHDIQFTVGIAMTVLLIILIVFYKKLLLPIILFIPTVVGALLAITVLYVIRDKISAISLGIGSVLLGVTLDYALHILTHIRSNNNIKSLYEEISKPVLMSSLTTALAFLCLLFLNSQALQDLGIFAAISVIGASVFALIFIPQVYRQQQEKRQTTTIIDKFSAIPLHKKTSVFIGLGILLIISCFTYNNVSFNNDITKLNYEPPKLMAAQKRLDSLTNIASKSVYIAAYGTTLEDALVANDIVYKKLSTLKENGNILNFSSIGALVQSHALQEKKLIEWHSFWNDSIKKVTKTQLIESGSKLGFKPKTYQPFYNLLQRDFTTLSRNDYNTLSTINVSDYISTKQQFTTVTSLVKLDHNQLEQLNNTFQPLPNTLVIDRQGMNETFLGNLKNDFNRLVGYSLIVVLLVLLVFYRSFSLTLVTSIPIALTWFTTIGLMGLLGIEFNIFNIIISTFIFGLGVDYSIFITNGLLHEHRTGERKLPTHKTSVILSVITTILGVGIMIFAKHPALYTISLVSIIGILSALLISFTIQPILFKLFIGSKTKRPISFRVLIHSMISFLYYGLGTFLLPLLGMLLFKIIPISKKVKMPWFHKIAGKFLTSVLYSNPFVKKKIINTTGETFEKPAVIIANHTSFLDTLAIEMLHHKVIFLVNDWVYNSPVFGQVMKFVGYYPVSEGIEGGLDHLQTKIDQGYSLVVFPEGTRSYTNKMKRFHKGAFFLADKFNLDILPVFIHGNSEVIPKGSFPIRNGSITLNVLPRITPENINFGTTPRERTKKISAYFKQAFIDFRKTFENDTYFHSLVLEEYRYKGDALYHTVKNDLKSYSKTYKSILDTVDKKATIIHATKDSGELDVLLALDGPGRNITSIIKSSSTRQILNNSYIANTHYNIQFVDNITLSNINKPLTLIISTPQLSNTIKNLLKSPWPVSCILLKDGKALNSTLIEKFKYHVQTEDNNIISLKK
ncbi:MMPL family transporter [Mangrovimonas spongiae]|uniref:Glycerol acyltransferase n=1 Tax=Mangrovimonas spongiae TaxID=2494697 RepID=A0A3R9PM17_9FLAO|nr:MMPL family transporter [Mangrovimonas spongiae]RSK41392.1 glycerol acyltransferase [Mangrovimonas spongiae]